MLPLRPVEVEYENNRCCLELHNTSDSTAAFQYGHGIAYFDARSKGQVQINDLKHFPIDSTYMTVTLATLSPKPSAYDKPIDPTEMPYISMCTDITTEDTNIPTQDDKYPWLDPDDKWRQMTDAEILRMKLKLDDSTLNEKQKEEFLAKLDNFHDVFSLRDEIAHTHLLKYTLN